MESSGPHRLSCMNTERKFEVKLNCKHTVINIFIHRYNQGPVTVWLSKLIVRFYLSLGIFWHLSYHCWLKHELYPLELDHLSASSTKAISVMVGACEPPIRPAVSIWHQGYHWWLGHELYRFDHLSAYINKAIIVLVGAWALSIRRLVNIWYQGYHCKSWGMTATLWPLIRFGHLGYHCQDWGMCSSH